MGSVGAQSLEPRQSLPESIAMLVELKPSKQWMDHPLRNKIVASEAFRQIWRSPDVRKMRTGMLVAELAMGDSLESILTKLTSGGVTIAVDVQTEGVAMIAQSESSDWLKEYMETLVNLVRNDAKTKKEPDPIKMAEYRGISGYEFQKGIFAVVDKSLLVTNKSDLAKVVLDRFLDKTDGGLSSKESFRDQVAVQSARPTNSVAWAYIDLDEIRNRGLAQDLFLEKAKDFNAELILGGLLSTLQNSDSASAALVADAGSIALQLCAPRDPTRSEEKRDFFFGPAGDGAALPLLKVDQELASLSVYRDVSKLWLMAGDLFDQKVNDQLAQADNTLTTLFSGRDFGEDILGSFQPQLRLIAALSEREAGRPVPAVRLPSFALVVNLKDSKRMKPELKRIFQSLVGFLNVAGAQDGQPQLDLDMESFDGSQFVMARYVDEVDRLENKVIPIQYNFSPCLAFVGDRAILSSTVGLAKQIAANAPVETGLASSLEKKNTRLEVDAKAIRLSLEENRNHLVSQNIVEKGHSKKEAENEVDMLFKILDLFDKGTLDLAFGSQSELNVTLRLAE